MQNTQYYNLIKVEGTDIVNPLTQMNPNWDTIDATLRSNSVRLVSTATYSKSGTVHTINRNYAQTPVFRFTATADWNAGDSMIINGTGVNLITPAGEPLGEGAFVTGAQVIGIQNGTEATLMVSNKYLPTASEVTTDGGDSVQDYIDNTKFKNLETWTPNIGENWETFLARIRDNSTKTVPANFIRCTVDGVSGLIFRQSRRTSATSWQYETDYFTGNSLIKYAMSVGSDSAVLRKYDILNGTVQNLSSADAQTINIYGLDV